MTTLTARDFDMVPEPVMSPMRETLEAVKSTLRRHFEIVDWEAVEIIMAAAVAHYIPGEMLWVRFLGPSRSGKTELLRPITAHDDACQMGVITAAAIRGGFKNAPKLLSRIDGKLVITTDLAALMGSRSETRKEIFGVLRNVKDGSLTSDFGSTEGHLHQTATFDWILASTVPGIENQRLMEDDLGQRFIDLRWIPGDSEAMAVGAAQNNARLPEIRAAVETDVLSLLCRAKEMPSDEHPTLSDHDVVLISRIAATTAILRTVVRQDRRGNLSSLPTSEAPTELAQDFSRMARGLLLLGVDDWRPYIERIGRDCVPSLRATLLLSLGQQGQTVDELATSTRIPARTVRNELEQLEMLEVVLDVNGTKWVLTPLP